MASSAPTVEENVPEPSPTVAEKKDETSLGSNGSVKAEVKFEDPRWINGTWDLRKFQKDGKTNWDAVIDAGELMGSLSCLRLHYPFKYFPSFITCSLCVFLFCKFFSPFLVWAKLRSLN